MLYLLCYTCIPYLYVIPLYLYAIPLYDNLYSIPICLAQQTDSELNLVETRRTTFSWTKCFTVRDCSKARDLTNLRDIH